MRARLAALVLALAPAIHAAPAPPAPPAVEESVEVTGSRLGTEVRPVTVLRAADIATLPARDTATALSYLAGIDLRPRGPFGAQTDVGLFGSGFEGVMVLVDGFVVSDPQTGHHLLEFLPPLSAVERIEVLTGPAAAAYGPGAFGGVLQVFTRRPATEASGNAALLGGEHALLQAEAGGSVAGVGVAASHLRHDGYRPDTELSDSRAVLRAVRGGFDALLLWQDKSFGAWQAYSNTYPDEWETVRGLAGRLQWTSNGWQLAAGWRHKFDRFLLDRTRPAFYDARHTTDTPSVEATHRGPALGGSLLVGASVARDRIDSNVLGQRERGRGGVFAEAHWVFGRAELDAGLRAERLDTRTWLLPQLAVSRTLGGGWRAFGSFGRAARLPSFTELYSRSAAFVGNAALEPEEAWGLELGARGPLGAGQLSLQAFRRDGREVIDFVRRAGSAGPLAAANVQEQRVTGIEAAWDGAAGRWHWRLDTLLLDATNAWPPEIESRYVGDTLRHRETAVLGWSARGWTASGALRAEQRTGRAAHAEVDLSLARTLGPYALRLDVRNVLDEPARNFYGGELAGRWIWAGITRRFM